jgi:hypothetical protein
LKQLSINNPFNRSRRLPGFFHCQAVGGGPVNSGVRQLKTP